MSKYTKIFSTQAAYTAAQATLELPNVSLITENMSVAFNPYVPPRLDIITYEASAKLTETTSAGTAGLHTNAFNTTIKSHTFENGVGTIEFNDNVTSIGQYAFYGCSSLTNVTIPNGVTSIGDGAFYGCSGLTSVTIPNSVTSIGQNAFSDCSGLMSITIPSGVTSITNNAFSGCSGLTSIVVDSGNSVYDSRGNCNAIIKTSTNELITGCKNTVIPNTVTSIGDYAFNKCTGLISVTIPSSVTSIGDNAFYNCTGLTSVTIPSSVTSISYAAFKGCTGLTSVTVEATTPPTLGNNAFIKNASGRKIYVPSGSVNTYKSASGWSDYASDIYAIGS